MRAATAIETSPSGCVKLPPRRARYDLLATGEEIRRRFEERIDAREPDPPLAAQAPSA